MKQISNVASLGTIISLLASGCAAEFDSPPTLDVPALSENERALAMPFTEEDTQRLTIVLSEGKSLSPAVHKPSTPKAVTQPLEEDATRKLLQRIGIPSSSSTPAFELPAQSSPPPVSDTPQAQPFPPPSSSNEKPPTKVVSTSPLKILRMIPNGKVESAHSVQIQFDRPVVGLGMLEAVKRPRGVTLKPEPPGTWRWVDPSTLLYEPKTRRLPAATKYAVTVSKQFSAIDGSTLKKKERTKFRTPPPEVLRFYPRRSRDDVSTRPVMLLFFNQPVNKKEVANATQLTVGTREGPSVQLANPAEIKKDIYASRNYPQSSSDHVVALVPTKPLPPSAQVRITVEAGQWSTQGPLPATFPYRAVFRTHGPFTVKKVTCGGWKEDCRPGAPMMLSFTTQLNTHHHPEPAVTIEPPVENLKIELSRYGIGLSGDFQPLTTYTLTPHPDLQDEHQQKLSPTEPLEVEIGAPLPAFYSGSAGLIRRLPSSPSIPVDSIGIDALNVSVRKVSATDWATWVSTRRQRRAKLASIGQKFFERPITVSGPTTELHTTFVSLETILEDNHGMALVSISGTGHQGEQTTNHHWVAISDVFLDAWHSGEDILYVAASGPDGTPLPNLDIELQPRGPKAKTNQQGWVKLQLPSKRQSAWLISNGGGFLPGSEWGDDRSFGAEKSPKPKLSVLTIDDRGMYRPGEKAYIKGWVRRFDPKRGLRPLSEGATVNYEVTISGSKPIKEGVLTTGKHGSFSLELSLPEECALGLGQMAIKLRSGSLRGRYSHTFQVQEFRRNRFSVELKTNRPPYLVGESIKAQVSAQTYSGGPVGNADIHWMVHQQGAHYSPPGWSDWHFGQSRPWWWRLPENNIQPQQFESQTDPSGHAELHIDASQIHEPFPVNLDIHTEVSDRDRRRVSAHTLALVHPGTSYIGLKVPKLFINRGEKLEPQFVVVDIEGNPVAERPVTLKLYPNPGFSPQVSLHEPPVAECTQVSTTDLSTCAIEAQAPGRYVLRAEVTDEQKRTNGTEVLVYWSGQPSRPYDNLAAENVELAPDREVYAPGDYAKVTVRSPFAKARGYWWTVADTVRRFEPIQLEGNTTQLEIPISRHLTPNFQVNVWLAGGSPSHPREAQGNVVLNALAKQDRLEVTVTPRHKTTEPSQRMDVEITVQTANGKPVTNAEVTLAVVDEAILAASKSSWPDPIKTLWPERNTYLRSWHSRKELVLTSSSTPGHLRNKRESESRRRRRYRKTAGAPVEMAMMAKSLDNMPSGRESPAIRVDFRPSAHFASQLFTNEQGQAVSSFVLPDDLTQYRVRAIAATRGRSFGRGEASFVTQKKLSIEPALPRFLSIGDRVELPFIVQNQTNAPIPFTAAISTADGLSLETPQAVTSTIGPHSRVELRFPATVQPATEVSIRAIVTSTVHEDAIEKKLPIYAPTVREAFADYGSLEIKTSTQRTLTPPPDPVMDIGGLTIQVAPTQLLAARDAYTQVVEHVFNSAEQRASRLLIIATTRRFPELFSSSDSAAAKNHLEYLREDFRELVDTQRSDGGWAYWPQSPRPDSFITAHITHALLRLQSAHQAKQIVLSEKEAYELESSLNRALTWLEQLPRYIATLELPPAVAASIQAHALWVRSLSQSSTRIKDVQLVLELAGGYQRASTEVLAWLYGVTVQSKWGKEMKALQTALNNRLNLTAKTAHLVSTYSTSTHLLLFGPARADAIYLLGLLESKPGDPLVEKLLRGLLSGRRATGGWRHTQENAWALLAVANYAESKEQIKPSFSARAWVGDQLALETRYSKRTQPRSVTIPTRWLSEHLSSPTLTLGKEGAGRMYFRLGWTYVSKNLDVSAANRGIAVTRRYRAVDNTDDVQKTEDGWTIRAGARVQVELEIAATATRHHVAVVDRLPAGFEPLYPGPNPGADFPIPQLDGEENIPHLWRSWTWDHEALRDTGAEAFAIDLQPGIHRYTYITRATTPGEFIAGPVLAEEMYAPETHGRSSSDRVKIVANK
ncbi:MAG: hypothetical protein KTR25_21015 [Myxococcales bacterium]|nr:hypothetical protein [Myxococcales bacterium]